MGIQVSNPVANVASTANASSYSFNAFTPAANATLVMMAFASGTTAAGSVTGGLTWTKDSSQLYKSTSTAYLFWANTGASPGSLTFAFDCTGDAATGCIAMIFQFTGSDVASGSPVAQSKTSATTAANPTITFLSNMNGNNAYCAGFGVPSNPPGATPPSIDWTEIADTGYNSPTSGAAGAYRANGETGTTITFTAASAAYGMLAIEINQSIPTAIGPFTQFTDLPLRRKPPPPQFHLQAVLPVNPTPPPPASLPVSTNLDTPLWDKRNSLTVFSGQQVAAGQADAVVVPALPLPSFELPVLAKKRLHYSQEQQPLSDDSTGPFPQQWVELPVEKPATLWRRHSFQGVQQAGVGPDYISLPPAQIFELPLRLKLRLHYDWLQSPLTDDSIGPFPHQVFELAPVGKKQPPRDFQLSPLAGDFISPLSDAIQVFDLPLGRKFLKHSFDGFSQEPLSSDSIEAFSKYHFELPLLYKGYGRDYTGQQTAPFFVAVTPGPIQSSLLFDLAFESRRSATKRQLLFMGWAGSPLSANAAVGTTSQFLPLLGVGQ